MKPRFRNILLALIAVGLFGSMSGSGVVQAQQATFSTPVLVVNTSFLNVRTGPGVQYTVLVTVVGGTELPVLGVANDQVWYQVATDGGPGWVNIDFTLARGDFTNVPLVRPGEIVSDPGQGGGAVPSASLASGRDITGAMLVGGDLRASPSFESLIIRRALPNDPLTVYPLLGQTIDASGVNWYLVSIPEIGTGWVDRIMFAPLACGGEVVGVTERPTSINFDGIAARDGFILEQGTQGFILGRNPSQSLEIRFELADGTLGNVLETDVRVRTEVASICDNVPAVALGQGGGAVPNDTQPGVTVPMLAANRVIVNTGFLNIRSGPSAGFSVVATVPGGTELEVLGRATDDVWYLVEGDFGQGWLNSQFTIFRGSFSTVPVLRNAEAIAAVTGNTNTAALGQGGGAVPVAASSIVSGQRVTGVQLAGGDLRSDPSYDALIIRRAVPNDPLTIYPLLGQTQDAQGVNWYLVNIPEIGVGWLDKIEFRPLECGNDSVFVTNAETSITFDAISTRDSFLLPFGTEGYVVGRRGEFLLFQLVDGTVGNVIQDVLIPRADEVRSVCQGVTTVTGPGTVSGGTVQTAPQPAVSGNRIIVNTGNLNIRSGPSAGFSVVATVPGGTEIAVTGRTRDGVWYLVQGTFGQGWLNSQFVLFRGNYGSVPVVN